MSVTVAHPSADVTIVKIAGEIGLSALVGQSGKHSGVDGDNFLDTELRRLVPEPTKVVVIDLTAASYLSSMGIGTLMRFRKRLAFINSDVRVAATGQMITLLKLGRLDQLLPIFPSVEAAMA